MIMPFIIPMDLLLLASIVIFILKMQKIRKKSTVQLQKFGSIKDEFETLNSSLPVGFFYLTDEGLVKESNEEFKAILKTIEEREDYYSFNIFNSSSVISKDEINHLKETGSLDAMFHTNNPVYSDLLIRINKFNADKEKGYTGVIIDKSEDIAASHARTNMYNMFQLAMDRAKIAVATINVFDNSFNVTNAWYSILHVKKGASFHDSFINAPKEERIKVTNFMNRIRNIQSNEEEYKKYYGYNIIKQGDDFDKIDVTAIIKLITDGIPHYIKLYGILTEYSPDEGKMMAEMVLSNIDEQVSRELRLLESLHKTRSAQNLKNKSIANMSTEIKEPLQTILTNTDKIFASSDSELSQNLLRELVRSNEELLLTISEVINISRIESAAYMEQLVNADPGRLVSDILSEFKSMLKKNVFIEYHPSRLEKVCIDARLVKELLRDLAISSAKRTSKGSITFYIREEPSDDASSETINLFVAISDTGEPLSKEETQLDNYKLLSKTIKTKTALESYIVRHLANILNGHIGFRTEKQFGKNINTSWCRFAVKKAVQELDN